MNPDILLAREISARLTPSRAWPQMRRTNEPHPEGTIWENEIYSATLRRYTSGWPFGGGKWALIGIWCEDGEARHDWRDFQRIKNDLVGPDWEALELYPSEQRLMDPSNYYMLWCAPKIPLGKFERRVLATAETAIAPQRPFTEQAKATA